MAVIASRAAILRAARAGSPGAGQPTYPPQGGSPWIGQLPSYATEPGSAYQRPYGPFLPRPGGTFTDGAFGPLPPILPVPVDQPGPGLPRAQPRRWQPYVGYNLPVGQPGNEGYKLASFDTLKTLAETYSILRTCIEIRKNEIRALEWDITLTPDAAKAYQGDRKAMRDFSERRDKAKAWFRRPDPNYLTFESFLHASMDQVFTIDALSLYMAPKRARGLGRGLLGSDLDCLWLINGSSIRPLQGLHGEVPLPPAPAFQQYEFGVPRADLTTMLAGLDLNGEEGQLLQQVRGDQLIYYPYLQRADSPYGFSLVEQALIPIMTGLRRQAMQLDYFTESSTPRVYISPGDTTLTPNQIRELQDALNAVASDVGWMFKVQVLPPGSKVMPVKEMATVDDSDNWIATEVAMVCNISPVELGLIPKISSVASPFAAREMAQASRSIHERTSTKPTLTYMTSVFDMILQQVCHQEDMRFIFNGMEETQDRAASIDMGVKAVQSGLQSIDEVRVNDLHLPPWGTPETSSALVFTQMGPVPLGQAAMDTVSQIRAAVTGNTGDPRAQSAVEALQRRASVTGQSPRKALPAGTSGQGRLNGSVTQRQARRGGALAPAHALAEGSPGHSGASSPSSRSPSTKAAHAELEALGRHLSKGMPLAEWVPVHVPGHLMAMIAQDLDSGLSAGYAVKAAASLLPKANAPLTAQQAAAQRQQAQQQQAQQQAAQQAAQQALAAQYQAQLQAAFATAYASSAALVAAWVAGTLAVTAAGLAALILAALRNALLPVLQALWTAAWQAAEQSTGSPEDQAALEAFLATSGENWLAVISGTGEQALLDAISRSLAAGTQLPILDAIAGILTADRADAIAVSEITRAWNSAIHQTMVLAGVAYRTWHTRNDGKVCKVCKGNQAQGPVAMDRPFASGLMHPPQHPRCRCWIAPSAPPPPNLAGKVLRREVGLNGQESWTEWEPAPETAGGRVFYPHRADGSQFTEAVPGAVTGGEPPRWDGSEPQPVTEHTEDPDFGEDAGIGPRPDIGARPGSYWPAPYMDGWWPSPHGHGTRQPPTSSPGSATGRPPNAAGKRRGGDAAARFLRGKPAAKASDVYRLMLENFPPAALGWVKRIRWTGPVDLPPELVDQSGKDGWAASHETSHVDEIAGKLRNGEHVNPGIVVLRAGHNHAREIDGRHRLLAAIKAGKPYLCYVGWLDAANEKAAYDTYHQQKHSGDDPRNKSFTAGNLGLPGNVSGLTPFNLQGAPPAPRVAGLVLRAADTGRVLMLQRALTDTDPAAGLLEFPGGHADEGEPLFGAACREFGEETGHPVPPGDLTGRWTASNGIYEGFVVTIPHEDSFDLSSPREIDNPDGDTFEPALWVDPGHIAGNPAVRPELVDDFPLVLRALNGARKSAQTPVVSTVHHPLGHEGLWHTPDRHVGTMQQLPAYVQNTARALMRDQGMDESRAIATAINAIRDWAEGRAFGGKVKVTDEVRQAATRALAELEALRASHH